MRIKKPVYVEVVPNWSCIHTVALATFMLQQIRPNLEEIKLILEKGMKHGSNRAKYINLILEVYASEGFSENEVISAFRDLFERRQLANCRDTILNTVGPHFSY